MKNTNFKELSIVIPVFNDFESLSILISRLGKSVPLEFQKEICLIIVDDSSQGNVSFEGSDFPTQFQIDVVQLRINLGHQRAIAVGLCYVFEEISSRFVSVMDSDGEDRPEDVWRLFEEARKNDSSVFANRKKRSEGLLFRFFYLLYKFIFLLLIGKPVSFGNFSVFPASLLDSLVYNSNLWNNYAVTFLKSSYPMRLLDTHRGERYLGKSKMNFSKLFLHGFSGISIYSDLVTFRVVFFSLLIIIISLAGILTVVSIRFFTEMAIPGWATYSVLALTIILFQSFIMGFFMLMTFLANRSNSLFIPIKEFRTFILGVLKKQ